LNEIEKEIDNLGRIVLPNHFRKKLGMDKNSSVLISMKNNSLIITAKATQCALCECKIKNESTLRLCESCISKVKNL
jgi:bifunctional DNA-binding transcriptional regulator/antitoxin component of YhaV-PrlF toxin-antitoxin module